MLLAAILLGVAGGFVLSIPPGPISIAVTKNALEGMFRPAMMIALGAALMDIVYILVSTFTSSAIVLALSSLILRTKWFPLLFQIACIIVLLFLGIRYLTPDRCEAATSASEAKEKAQEERARKLGYSSPLMVGVLIALTNLASPTFLPSMIGFVGFLHANELLQRGALYSALFSIGFGIGTTLWFFVMLRILLKFRKKLSKNFVTTIYRFAGSTFILFAAVIAYHAAFTTEWGNLL